MAHVTRMLMYFAFSVSKIAKHIWYRSSDDNYNWTNLVAMMTISGMSTMSLKTLKQVQTTSSHVGAR